MRVLFFLASASALTSVVSASGQPGFPIGNFFSKPHPNQHPSNVTLDRAPGLEAQRPYRHGRTLTSDLILAALFPYSAVTLEAVVSPFRVIARSFFERHAPRRSLEKDDVWKVVTIPTYADHTERGWRAALHGYATLEHQMKIRTNGNGIIHDDDYKHRQHLDKVIERLLVRATMDKTHNKAWRKHFYLLNDTEQANARGRAEAYMQTPLQDFRVSVNFPGECNITVYLDGLTDREGGIAEDILIPKECDEAGADDTEVDHAETRLNLEASSGEKSQSSTSSSSAKLHFVPPTGVTFISDIDDVLRVAEGMPEIMARWDMTSSKTHFHYSTLTPEVNSDFYIRGTEKYYPEGSWDFRPVGFTNYFASMIRDIDPRWKRLVRIIERFPARRAVMLGDTSNPTTMRDYPELMRQHPDQVQCLLIRDNQQTEASDWREPSTRHLLGLPSNKFFLFTKPSDLDRVPPIHLKALSEIPLGHLYKLDDPIESYARQKNYPGPEIDQLEVRWPNATVDFSDGFWYRNDGCFPYRIVTPLDKASHGNLTIKQADLQSTKPYEARKLSKSPFKGISSVMRAVWWRVKCDFLKGRDTSKLRQHCPFDLREGGDWEQHGNGKGYWDQEKMQFIRTYKPKTKQPDHPHAYRLAKGQTAILSTSKTVFSAYTTTMINPSNTP
ncbi:hypothetical protein CAC42_1045 [Sphaceloma murrayae]|uniref:Phosphatidate phosphatase APP1 catalytic domain-containing protein n=1 Tax=Sphaceloma murrayae TaxID=2082308 RepID=A0A2K1R1V5_9PEZI|nr:hypothetical protein CAC42_1045 [Sphaceloma murrayae]